MYIDGVYYWYGENKEKTIGDGACWHWGVRCYVSTDLYNWEDKGLIIEPDLEDEESGLHPKQMMDRPHIIYNQDTKKYVCWLKIIKQAGQQRGINRKVIHSLKADTVHFLRNSLADIPTLLLKRR